MTEHTPTPWKALEALQDNGPNYWNIGQGPFKESVCNVESEANAKRIVHCVNNFDAMLATLERVQGVADTAANLCRETAPEESRLFEQDAAIIRAALAKAKESDHAS